MADTETKQVITEYPARLQMSMLAPVRRIAELLKEGDKEAHVVGYVFGKARGVSFRNNPNSADGEAAAGLIGAFEGIPSYVDLDGLTAAEKCEGRARLASGVCFLPPQAQATYVNAILKGMDAERPANSTIKRGQRADVLGVECDINLEIAIRKSNSPVGYEWVVRGMGNVSAESPIERMRKALGTGPGADLAKIVDRAEKAALPAPAKAKGGKKK
jgi:hypothetical protein